MLSRKFVEKENALLLFHGGDFSVNKATPLSSSLILTENVQTNQEPKEQYLQSYSYSIDLFFFFLSSASDSLLAAYRIL